MNYSSNQKNARVSSKLAAFTAIIVTFFVSACGESTPPTKVVNSKDIKSTNNQVYEEYYTPSGSYEPEYSDYYYYDYTPQGGENQPGTK
jgi:hypothetical protein